MKKLLITGFDPFGGQPLNPSWEAVLRLPDAIGQWQLTRLMLPTVFATAAAGLLEAADALCPDAVICVGQAGGRSGITPEVVGINLREARIPDNAGQQPVNEPVIPGAPAAYFATLPVRRMVAALQAEGIAGGLSYTAGAFVCNDVLYTLLHHYDGTAVQAGFIHVPWLPEQAKEGQPSMPLEQIIRGLTVAVRAM